MWYIVFNVQDIIKKRKERCMCLSEVTQYLNTVYVHIFEYSYKFTHDYH